MSAARSAIAAIVLLLALAAGVWLQGGGEDTLVRATRLPEPRPVGAVDLVDMHGESFGIEELRGQWRLAFFGFANCPDICPITLQQLASARLRLADAGVTPLPGILFVSVDPARDTPDVLADYAASFGEGVIAVTGEPDALRDFAGSLGVYFDVAAGDGAAYSVSHSAAVFLISPEGELHAVFSAPQDVDALVNDLPILTEAA